jgi:ubiquitin-conjugating enzyme E2 Z
MSTFVSKETVTRLLKDVKQILKNPLTENGIYYVHDDTDMMKGYALIIGPSDTPYFGGNYFFELNYPADFPHSPPKVKYCTNGNNIRFNPNLYACGKVCISLLNTWRGDQWTSCQTISTVLLTLCTLLCENPLLNEPGVPITHKDTPNYTEIIEYANIDIAICNILCKKEGFYLDFFENFYPFVKENFIKNYDNILEFAEKKKPLFETPKVLTTGFYSMNVTIDYKKVVEKLIYTKTYIGAN